jgi:hypothetical protein
MARRNKGKTGKSQRKRLCNRSSDKLLHKPLIDVAQRVGSALLCSNRFVPSDLSGVIGGFYRDCLAHHVQERIQVIYYELEAKTRYSRHAQALVLEVGFYMQTYKENTVIVIAPTIHLLSSLFFANPGIKSDVFMGSFDMVFQAVNGNCDKLGFLLLEYLFAVFDSYVRNVVSTSTPAPVTWNTQCVEHLFETGASKLVLQVASELASSPSGFGKYSQEDSLRIGWVVAKVFCIYLQDNPSSEHAESLSSFNDVSSSIGAKIENLQVE